MIVYDDYEANFYNPNEQACKYDEYEVSVYMSSKLFSGTDDKVEIRLYGRKNETTDWFELTQPFHNGLERLSEDIYCVKTDKHFKKLKKIGIRKFGTDDMMIDSISIRHRFSGRISGGSFPVDRWIKKDAKEYIYKST